jgi:outer membrane biosynthesis protein TonB
MPPEDAATSYVPAPAGAAGAGVPEMVLKDPVPAGYRQTIRQRLRAHLMSQFRAASLPEGSVDVSFVLSHDGRLIGEGEVSSPQGEAFVSAAQQALASAQPFPPFPDSADATEVRFRVGVEYEP